VVFLRIVRQIQSKGRSFLALKRLRVRNEYEDGRLSRPYAFEMVERRGIDSVALIPFRHGRERIWILIKAGFRPALSMGRPTTGRAILSFSRVSVKG